MGIFDSLKNALGGKTKPDRDTTASPSQMLRDAGLDPTGLKFSFAPGSITVSGDISSEADRDKILQVLGTAPGIDTVNDHLAVAAPAAPEPPPAAEPEPAESADSTGDSAAGGTYTVQPGDTLWKISEQHYGDGTKYMKIYEANSELLDNPDRIFPGQKLVIPVLD